MIVFLADGRLGNQIFQYAFLKTIQKDNEKIIVSGFEDLKEVSEIDDIVNLNKKNRWMRALIFRIIKPILTYLSDRKIISSISVKHENVLENYRRETATYSTTIGKLKFLIFVKLGFFQSEKFFNKKIIDTLIIKDKYLKQANVLLNTIPKNTHKVFIHIRRGDYKKYTVYGKSTLLPISYYKERMEWFMKNKKDSFFIFLSDESNFIEKEFSYIDNKLISSNNHFGIDLAIMTLCKSAILSPSSFGWWGSYLMKERDTIFAPKYWLGFNSGINFGTNILSCPSFSKEIEVIND